jgi:hypothetical protein
MSCCHWKAKCEVVDPPLSYRSSSHQAFPERARTGLGRRRQRTNEPIRYRYRYSYSYVGYHPIQPMYIRTDLVVDRTYDMTYLKKGTKEALCNLSTSLFVRVPRTEEEIRPGEDVRRLSPHVSACLPFLIYIAKYTRRVFCVWLHLFCWILFSLLDLEPTKKNPQNTPREEE